MGKTFKKVVAAAVAALTVGVFSIGAAAAVPYGTMGRQHFRKSVPDYNRSVRTDSEEKTDYYTYAVVYLDAGSTVSDTQPIIMRAFKNNGDLIATPPVTATKYGTGTEGRYELPYSNGGNYGEEYYLLFSSGRYGAIVNGYWAP